MTEAEANATLTSNEKREVDRIEADLAARFGAFAPILRQEAQIEVWSTERPEKSLVTDVTDIDGWQVLGRVSIPRHMLPVEGSLVGGKEDEDMVVWRAQILDAILEAFKAGQMYRRPPMPSVKTEDGNVRNDVGGKVAEIADRFTREGQDDFKASLDAFAEKADFLHLARAM